jgi:hypothetical protein
MEHLLGFPPHPLPYGHRNPTYGAILQSMEEEPLDVDVAARPVTYRLLSVPVGFGPQWLVRVFQRDHAWWVVGKVADGIGHHLLGKLAWEFKRVLHVSESLMLQRLIDRLQVLTMPEKQPYRRMCLDGVTWILEAVQSRQYRLIYRSNPNERPLTEFADYVKKLARVHDFERDPGHPADVAKREEEDRLAAAAEAAAIRSWNIRIRPMLVRLAYEGLTCPHCGTQTRTVRFVDKSPDAKSYFICRSCGRSFGPA